MKALTAALVLGLAAVARAERLPIQVFTSADGLAHDRVKCIYRDSRGIMWFCSSTGIDWFDGQRFSGHLLDDRLAVSTNDVLETPDHIYWIATNGRGVVRLDPVGEHLSQWPPPSNAAATPRLRTYTVGNNTSTNAVNKLFLDRRGIMWAGTDQGVFQRQTAGEFTPVALPIETDLRVQVWSFAQSDDGALWIGTSRGLFRQHPDSSIAIEMARSDAGNIWSLLPAGDGTMWIGSDRGVFRAGTKGAVVPELVSALPSLRAYAIHRTATGITWFGFVGGPLVRYDGREFRAFTRAQGLPDFGVESVSTDSLENLWIASGSGGGAMRILRNGFVTFGRDEGVLGEWIDSLFETQAGEVCAMASRLDPAVLQCFDGQKFVSVHPRLPASAGGWHGRRRTMQTRDGSWWFATRQGLYRFPPSPTFRALASALPSQIYADAQGVHGVVTVMFEDSQRDIWLAMEAPGGYAMARWRHASGAIEPIAVPSTKQAWEIGEDDHGGVWIGFRNGGLGRWREGRFEMIGVESGIAEDSWVSTLFRDRRGQLWVGDNSSRLGPLRSDEPWRDRPRFVRYTTAQVAPWVSCCFAEDLSGNLYVSTGFGIDRMDLERNWAAHYDISDGLADKQVWVSLRDRAGAMWFGTGKGIARLVPEPVSPPPPPETRIEAFRIGSVKYPLSMLGEIDVPSLAIPVGYSPIDIEYASAAGNVQYQHRLDGVDQDWQRPTVRREVTFANLAAGSYRFQVRAIDRSGLVYGRPATIAFTMVPPYWQRSWFITAIILAVIAGAYAVHRYRVGQLIAVERIRTRIATDLHDDIGSSLSRIAILSEVAARRVDPRTSDVVGALDTISETAGELVDSMSDIVWAINPHQDALVDLAGRMRRFASDLLTAKNIAFRFDAPDRDGDVRLSPDVRRQVYLTFKEGVHNIVRHADCTEVTAALRIADGTLDLTLSDNGKGFDESQIIAGHGLASVRARARAVNSTLTITTAPGAGTTLHLRLPLRSRRTRA